MSMPKTTVNKDSYFPIWKNKIRMSFCLIIPTPTDNTVLPKYFN